MPELRPVTDCLDRELLGELRRRGIVFWLDRDAHYTGYVDALAERHRAGDFPYPVVPFRGSFLEVLLALEDQQGGLDRTGVLIHLPGFTEDLMRGTPLLELYKAGYRHRRALDTVIREAATGNLPPGDIDAYLGAGDYDLARADAWLAGRIGEGRAGLAGLLDHTSVEIVVRELLIKDTFLSGQLDRRKPGDLDVLRAYLERRVGMTAAWEEFIRGGDAQSKPYTVLTDALASWILCVEYADDLGRVPHLPELRPLKALPAPLIELCRGLARTLREQVPDAYENLADLVEAHLGDELRMIRPEDLGRVDTFRTEEARILEAAIDALISGDCARARQWADDRSGEVSFWLGRDRSRRITWSLVEAGARLGCLLDAHPRPLDGVTSLVDAAARYTATGCQVDHAHRGFEQRRANLLGPQLPHFLKLKEAVDALRGRFATWADDLARDFSGLCRSQGFLPEPSLQQRTLYEQVIHPLTQGSERTAVFLIDALRYEMATELKADLEAAEARGTRVTLSARFAELPTITAVGMNALAPVARSGLLTLAGTSGWKGFGTGEFTVDKPEARARAMGQRSTGEQALSLGLEEICELEPATLRKKVAQKRLIVVHHRLIDDAGEAGVGLGTFEQTLGQIKAAWHHLKNAGIKQFVFTSDHGFLLTDAGREPRPYGKKTDPGRRHVLAAEPRQEAGLLTVSLAELRYEGRAGWLLMPEDTQVFDTGDRTEGFVHGGNSLQERLIPVLTVASKVPSNQDLSVFKVVADQASDALGCHRIRVRLELDRARTDTLPFARSTPIDLALRVPGRSDIRVSIKDVIGKGTVKGDRLQLVPGAPDVEVFFGLAGPEDERVRVEVFHPDGIEHVGPCPVDGWFDAEGRSRRAAPETPAPAEWADQLPDDGTRRVFVHLHQYGSITEAEVTQMLGSPRQFRQFSRGFEDLVRLTPLKVEIVSVAGVKRYVRKGQTDGTCHEA